MFRSLVFIVAYVSCCVLVCGFTNLHIEQYLMDRMWEKWNVYSRREMTQKQRDRFETRQTIYECTIDMLIGVALAIVYVKLYINYQ
jgi:hypothetical protein